MRINALVAQEIRMIKIKCLSLWASKVSVVLDPVKDVRVSALMDMFVNRIWKERENACHKLVFPVMISVSPQPFVLQR